MALKPGLYEQIISEVLNQSLLQLDPATVRAEGLDDGESHAILAEYLRHILGAALKELTGPDRLQKQIDMCNCLIQQLGQMQPTDAAPGRVVDARAERLLSIIDADSVPPVHPDRPDTPLSQGCILAGTRLDPSLRSRRR